MMAMLPLALATLALTAPSYPGPAIGETLPAFEAMDQSGRRRGFDDLTGPNGLVLVFYRTADW
jgi:hypothetical protein